MGYWCKDDEEDAQTILSRLSLASGVNQCDWIYHTFYLATQQPHLGYNPIVQCSCQFCLLKISDLYHNFFLVLFMTQKCALVTLNAVNRGHDVMATMGGKSLFRPPWSNGCAEECRYLPLALINLSALEIWSQNTTFWSSGWSQSQRAWWLRCTIKTGSIVKIL